MSPRQIGLPFSQIGLVNAMLAKGLLLPFKLVRKVLYPKAVITYLLVGIIVMSIMGNIPASDLTFFHGASKAKAAWIKTSTVVVLYPLPLTIALARWVTNVGAAACTATNIKCELPKGFGFHTITVPVPGTKNEPAAP